MSRPPATFTLPQQSTDEINAFLGDKSKFNAIGAFGGRTAEQILGRVGVDELMFEIKAMAGRKGGDLASVKSILADIKKDMDVLADLTEQQENLDRQEFEIKDHELHPAKLSVSQLAKQYNRDISFEGASRNRHQTGRADVPSYLSSLVGGTKAARDAVRRNSKPMIHVGEIPSTYRNLVIDSISDVNAEKEIARAELKAKLAGNPPLTKKDKQFIKKTCHSSRYRVLSNLSEAAAFKTMEGVNWVGRGIFSKSDAAKDSRYLRYKADLAELTAQNRFLLEGKHGASYLKALEKYYQTLVDNNGQPLAPAQFDAIQQLIRKEIEEVDKAEAQKLKEFDEKASALNKEMYEKIQTLVKKDDEAWPYHIAQAVLLFSPFGFFNYMVPIANIFGPIFAGAGTAGEHLAQVASNVPFFGDIFAGMKLDVALTAIIDNTPGVAQITNAINAVIQTDAAQNLFGAMSPMVTGSPLVPLAIAIGFNMDRIAKDVKRGEESDTVDKEGRKKLHAEFEKLQKSFKGDDAKKRIAEFTAKELSLNVERHFANELAQFIAGIDKDDAKELAIFDNIAIGGMTLKQMKELGSLDSVSGVIDVIFNPKLCSGEQRGKILQSYFVYDKMRKDALGGKEFPDGSMDEYTQKCIAMFNAQAADPERFAKTAKAEYEKRSEDIVIETAEKGLGLKSIYAGESVEERSTRAKDYQLQIVQARANSRVSIADVMQMAPTKPQPKSAVLPPFKATPLGIALGSSQQPISVR